MHSFILFLCFTSNEVSHLYGIVYLIRQSEQLLRSMFTKDQVANNSLMSGLWKSKCEDCKYWTHNLRIIAPLMLIGIVYIIAVFILTGIKLNLNFLSSVWLLSNIVWGNFCISKWINARGSCLFIAHYCVNFKNKLQPS
jgi:hypothetical protein